MFQSGFHLHCLALAPQVSDQTDFTCKVKKEVIWWVAPISKILTPLIGDVTGQNYLHVEKFPCNTYGPPIHASRFLDERMAKN